MKRLILVFSMFGGMLLLTSCFQIHADRDDICTIPTTNNPQVVPNHGPSFNPG